MSISPNPSPDLPEPPTQREYHVEHGLNIQADREEWLEQVKAKNENARKNKANLAQPGRHRA